MHFNSNAFGELFRTVSNIVTNDSNVVTNNTYSEIERHRFDTSISIFYLYSYFKYEAKLHLFTVTLSIKNKIENLTYHSTRNYFWDNDETSP